MTYSYPTDDKDNRIRGVLDNMTGAENPDDLMMDLLEIIGSRVTPVPDIGKFYTFVYSPKTPNIQYDAHPLVAVTDIFRWGFRGMNFHWGETRQYTWNEIVGQLYEIFPEELSDAQEIPFGKIGLNS
tara:strand:- start:47 stop:427 length:381 start_codon:yes stop_codon:yes gene_type:complete